MHFLRVPYLRHCALAFVFMLSGLTCFCWGVTGHRVVGEIAQQHLSKKARKELKKLIGEQSLAYWANWGDFIKSDTSWNHAYNWHFVSVPSNLPKAEFIAMLKALPEKNLYNQTKLIYEQLKDKSLPLEKRQEALKFLIHFVGDIHQPLHVGRKDDQGGNKIVVYWFDKKTNLHSLWDSKLIDFQQYSYTEYARVLDLASKEQIKEWQASSLEDWFYESATVAEKIYNSVSPEEKLSYRYNFLFQKTLDEQLLKGGIHLAALLNAAFE